MNQLSIYEFLSFFLPGFLAIELARYCRALSGVTVIIARFSDAEKGLVLVALCIIAGLFIHSISYMLSGRAWYRWVINPPVGHISAHSHDIQSISPGLDRYCQEVMGVPLFTAKEKVATHFFDHAYFFLEANNRIGPAKGYQSLYYFLRNVLLLAAFSFLLLALLLLLQCPVKSGQQHGLWLMLVLAGLSMPVCIFTGRFCRRKMVERVFWTFYILRKDPLK